MLKKGLLRASYLGFALSIAFLMVTLGFAEAAALKPAPKPTPSSRPHYGGTLKIINSISAMILGDPVQTSYNTDRLYAHACVETLVSFDDMGMVAPGLAESWVISPDFKSITFKLRKGVKFHDGTDFNAEAAKYNLDRYRAAPLPDLKSVASIDVLDDYTIRFYLSNWDNLILGNLALRAGFIISPTAAKAHDKDWLLTHPVGTGPFKFVRFERDVSLKFEKFDGYWQRGKPYLDALQFYFIADPMVASASFQTGEGNVLISQNVKELYDLKNKGKYSIYTCPHSVTGLAGDSIHPNSPFADVRVRRAVEHAIDKQALVSMAGYGMLEAINQPASVKNWSYNSKVVGYPYNPTKAKQLLAEAGYPNGLKTKLTTRNNPEFVQVFTAVQGFLGKVGIDAQLEPVGQSLYLDMLKAKGWEGLIHFVMGMGTTDDPVQAMQLRMSGKGQSNKCIAYPPSYDAKIAEALKANGFESKKTLIQEAIKMAVDDYALMIPLYIAINGVAMYPQVHGTKLMDPSNECWTPADAWLSK